jgi:hypothetical protein
MQDNTQYVGLGKVKKVKMLRTAEDIEMKEARIRQRRKERYLTMQQTMLKAVEKAVALHAPMPHIQSEPIVEENTTQENADTKAKRAGIGQSLIDTVKGAQGSVASFFNRMYTAVMEED